jgi:hypothetical protein
MKILSRETEISEIIILSIVMIGMVYAIFHFITESKKSPFERMRGKTVVIKPHFSNDYYGSMAEWEWERKMKSEIGFKSSMDHKWSNGFIMINYLFWQFLILGIIILCSYHKKDIEDHHGEFSIGESLILNPVTGLVFSVIISIIIAWVSSALIFFIIDTIRWNMIVY